MTPINLEFSASNTMKATSRGDVIVVIDVLRCSSTIITALAVGATEIIPVKTVKEAQEIRKTNPSFILAGEREGVPLRGFRYGNSPSSLAYASLKGTHIILTTTNGTAAISRVIHSKHVLIGALLNARDVAESAYNLAVEEGNGITLTLSETKVDSALKTSLEQAQ